MSIFPAIEAYLVLQGNKYISPDKAGELRGTMLDFKQKGAGCPQGICRFGKAISSILSKINSGVQQQLDESSSNFAIPFLELLAWLWQYHRTHVCLAIIWESEGIWSVARS